MKPTHLLLRPLGKARTQWLWRIFGLFTVQSMMFQWDPLPTLEKLGRFPPAMIGCFLGGLALMIWGPNPVLLLGTGAFLWLHLYPVTQYAVEVQVAEEYLLLMALPVMGLLLAGVAARGKGTSQSIDPHILERAHVALFRIAAMSTMFFAGLAKLNTDFFNPQVSCGTQFFGMLAQLWALPFERLASVISPVWIAASELLVPVLLLSVPAIGIFYTTAVVGAIGHIGATPFAISIIMMAASFIEEDDITAIRAGFKRVWPMLAAAAAGTAFLSHRYYTGDRSWAVFLIYQVFVLGVLFLSAGLIFRRGPKHLIEARKTMKSLLPGPRKLRIAMACFLALTVFNGFTPYLGLKYRLSFAMLSNLRVDTARWNSIVIPRWVYLPKTDPFIHLDQVQMDPAKRELYSRLTVSEKRALYPGLFSSMSFRHRLDIAADMGVRVDLGLVYRGERFRFEDAGENKELQALLAEAGDSKMFQEWLTLEGPQNCMH